MELVFIFVKYTATTSQLPVRLHFLGSVINYNLFKDNTFMMFCPFIESKPKVLHIDANLVTILGPTAAQRFTKAYLIVIFYVFLCLDLVYN